MDWVKAAAGESADNMPEGYHRATCSAVYTADKDGNPIVSKNGNNGVRLVFRDDAGQSASGTLWLTQKADWKIAQTLQIMGHEMEKLNAANLTLASFLSQDVCERAFKDRACWVQVEHNGQYANAECVHDSDVPPQLLKPAAAAADVPFDEVPQAGDDSIPF